MTQNGYISIYNRTFKRCFDIVIAFALLMILLPFYLIIAVAIVIDDGFPIFYRPLRGGYKNKPFRIIKFRTMIKNADQGSGTTAFNDSRITRVGKFLRKTKLDETSQLLNVITGSMSFIGPRPELLKYTEQYIGEENLIFEVRPGITDFSSIEFINLDEIVGRENPEEMYEKYVLKKKNELRIKYAKEVSLKTDVYLFCKTVLCVLKKAFRVIFCK